VVLEVDGCEEQSDRRNVCVCVGWTDGLAVRCNVLVVQNPQGAKRTHIFQIIVTFLFSIKKIMLTPKQPVIKAVLITYIDYSITENYIGKMASFLPYTSPEPLLKVLHHIY